APRRLPRRRRPRTRVPGHARELRARIPAGPRGAPRGLGTPGSACRAAAVALRRRGCVASFAYHDITDTPYESGVQSPGASAYTLGRAAFRRHLDAFAGVSLRPELVTAIDPTAPGRHLVLTFDDGGKSALEVGDALARRGWRGHFFIITSRIGERTFLDAAGIRSLRRSGQIIRTHSRTHPHIFRDQAPSQTVA